MNALVIATLLAAAQTPPLNVCALLDPKAIAAAQGTAPRETKASAQPTGRLTAQQCFFTLPDVSRSVSLQVTRAPPGELRERWEQLSGKVEKDPRGEEEEQRPPRPVSGVGRAAVWSGNQKAGALYVLAKGAIVRVSVGGPASEDGKIAACTALAKDALRHLGRAEAPILSGRR